jgi:hypothetical protein
MKLFSTDPDKKDPYNELSQRIDVLQNALNNNTGYKNIVSVVNSTDSTLNESAVNDSTMNDSDDDKDDVCLTDYQVYCVKQRALYLLSALKFAKQHMNDWSWGQCCDEAVKSCNQGREGTSLEYTKCGRTIQRWHVDFRKDCKFKVAIDSKHSLPPFLEANPDVVRLIVAFGTSNLATLSTELMWRYITCQILPAIIRMRDANDDEKNLSDFVMEEDSNNITQENIKKFLKEYGLSKVCLSTVTRWMHKLGFRYQGRKKTYYVDTHEKEETVKYRYLYVRKYLNYERRSYRWIQMKLEDAVLRDKNNLIQNVGYRYKDGDIDMIEFHVDDVPFDCDDLTRNLPYGGNLSVLNKETPIFLFGHDECIFRQYSFSIKTWKAPSGQQTLIPKDEGRGIMISAFQSREFGFGMNLTQDQLDRVNEYRHEKLYFEAESAKQVRGTAKKMPLKTSPFVVEFEYGSGESGKGYWNYDHLVVQLEDCVDVLKTLYPDHEFLFQFDHSSGHDRKRTDALSVTNLNLHHGGKQAIMRNSTILKQDGYLGIFNPTLKVNDIQYMSYQPGDEGPALMSAEDREKYKYDFATGDVKVRTFNKQELIQKLKSAPDPINDPRGTLADIQALCRARYIDTAESRPVIKEGWMGKPKGILQILIERGLIDKTNLCAYSLDGKKGVDGNLIPGSSLKEILANCDDFQNEITQLELTAADLKIHILRSPKCHPENAGEGVEYSWGCSKAFYRNLNFSRKKGYENFRNSVRESIGMNVLTTTRVRMFSAKARRYIVTYFSLSKDSSDDPSLCTPIKLEDIERLVKQKKSHRSVFDTHKSLCYKVLEYGDLTVI